MKMWKTVRNKNAGNFPHSFPRSFQLSKFFEIFSCSFIFTVLFIEQNRFCFAIVCSVSIDDNITEFYGFYHIMTSYVDLEWQNVICCQN